MIDGRFDDSSRNKIREEYDDKDSLESINKANSGNNGVNLSGSDIASSIVNGIANANSGSTRNANNLI